MEISESEYLEAFPPDKREKALAYALDIRKFEIDLYWKRAAYFWALIAATFTGYTVVQASGAIPDKRYLSVVLSCLGVLFSFGWHCVNRGSKQWQENWENHVDLLEDEVVGPLYKITLRRSSAVNTKDRLMTLLTGPWPVSVSGVNQIISTYVVLLWIILLNKALPAYSLHATIDWEYFVLVLATFVSCIGFVTIGRTYRGSYGHVANRRESHIRTSSSQSAGRPTLPVRADE